MANLYKNDRKDLYEKQTYNIIDVDKQKDKNFYICYNCHKEITRGFLCSHHKTIFCEKCITPIGKDNVAVCRNVLKSNPVFGDKKKEIVACVYLPIENIIFIKSKDSLNNI